MNLVSLKRIIGIKYNFVTLVLKPVISVLSMAVVLLSLYGLVEPLGNILSTGITIVVSGIVYFAVLLLVGGISENDIRMLPKSDKILGVMTKFRLIKR